jgi:hypothetical protein
VKKVNHNGFAVLPRSLADLPSRRDVLRGLIGAGLGVGAVRLPAGAAAGKTRRPHVRRNASGCVNVGGYCRNDDQCCSGICEGRRRKRKCRAHDTGGCRAGNQPQGCNGTDIVCTTSTGNPKGVCATTTGNGGYCVYSGGCYPCQTDADCQELCGPRGACFLCDDCPDTGGTSCGSPDDNGCDFP